MNRTEVQSFKTFSRNEHVLKCSVINDVLRKRLNFWEETIWYWCTPIVESTIMLRESSPGETSVMRLRLEGYKKAIRGHKKTHYEYALAKQICTSWK